MKFPQETSKFPIEYMEKFVKLHIMPNLNGGLPEVATYND